MLSSELFTQQLELILEDMGDGGVDTNTVEGAGIVNRIRGAYGELKAAYDFAKRSNVDEELIKEIDEIGGRLIQLADRLATIGTEEEDENYAEDDGSPI